LVIIPLRTQARVRQLDASLHDKAQQAKFNSLYQQHVNAFRRQGKVDTTVDTFSRALRRIVEFFDVCPDKITQDHLSTYFDYLIKTHLWSTVEVDLNGLQFFFKYILKRTWIWVEASASCSRPLPTSM
jgi:integrase/recombinase XerD